MIITEKSTKADIIDSAVELVDSQSERITELEQQRFVMAGLMGLLLLINLF